MYFKASKHNIDQEIDSTLDECGFPKKCCILTAKCESQFMTGSFRVCVPNELEI